MTLPTPRPHQRSMHPSKRAALVRRIDVSWQNQALCRKFPADDWFPAPSDSNVVCELIDVCQRCPAQRSCLAAALAFPEWPASHAWIGLFSVAPVNSMRVWIDGLVFSMVFGWLIAIVLALTYNRLIHR